MAFQYSGAGREQLFLLPISMRDWLEEGHLAWLILDVVAVVDTSALHERHPNDGPGRPAYDPDMMLALWLYAFATGLRSSRRIEAACVTDAAFRVIAGNQTPDHTTLCRFLVDHEAAMEKVFVEVLRLCAAAGLVSVGTVAIDGTKVGSDAALDRNRSREVVAQLLAEAKATDAAESAQGLLLGPSLLPVALSSRERRHAALQAALDALEAEDEAARAEAEAKAQQLRREAAEGRKPRGSASKKDPEAALARAEASLEAIRVRVAKRAAERAAKEAAAAIRGRKLPGREPTDRRTLDEEDELARAEADLEVARETAKAHVPQARGKVNLTDPESRIMLTKAGWVQGFNAQAAVGSGQIVIACSVTQEENDMAQYQPMVAAAQAALAAVGITEPIGIVLADAGYCSQDNLVSPGPDRLIATAKDWKQRQAARQLGTTSGPPPEHATPLEAMEHRVRTAEGAATYAQRGHTVEPVFGDHKQNRGFRRFRRRGLAAARSEWALWNTVHNLAKLFELGPNRPALN